MNEYIYPVDFNRKLVIHDREHFDSVIEFQAKNISEENWNKRRDLMSKISWLLTGDYGQADTLNIFKDNCANCFGFSLMRGKDCVLNGGIICHGQQQVETFTVSLSDAKGVYFGIHT